ncbi:MAG: nucleoside-diphosphate kinase [Clostridiales bacterium]|nr:nucleoside-diphosphate kinase [Clostridiales bacterium]MCF8021587.1 nucleoside-diphosphate kinase [Clostridiales bacterium]
MERTYAMVKPDGVQRGLVSEVISRFERRGLKIIGLKIMNISHELAKKHYAEHKDKPFFNGLIQYITSGPVVAMVLEGKSAVVMVREMMGATNPQEAVPGTIRGDFGIDIGRNIVHGSDTLENAEREIGLFFDKHEIVEYKMDLNSWIYE